MAKKSQTTKATPVAPKTEEVKENPLFPSEPRNFRIGGAIRHKTDLSRYVKWPRYVQIQRQRKILQQRLKCPPNVTQFKHTHELLRLLKNYVPETAAEKKTRLVAAATARKEGKEVVATKKNTIKCGLKHVTKLVEKKQAKLVVIADDCDPLEVVVWLPMLCHKLAIPYCIVKGKALLGSLVHLKSASCIALTNVEAADEATLKSLQDSFTAKYGDDSNHRKWSGGVMGLKTQRKLEIRAAAVAAEKAKKDKY
ncbi:hypothetical protein WA158_004911 [Blastocystis sp. Blastoise]